MKPDRSHFPQRYADGLRRHLAAKPGAVAGAAGRLGRAASALGLATLEIARIHERALVALDPAAGHGAQARRAESFFAEVIGPIVATYRPAREASVDRARLKDALGRRTAELAAANRLLEAGVTKHRSMAGELKAGGVRHARLLKESLRLQGDFQRLTHQALAAQEAERLKISRELNDEVAQTLLGIHVRLVSLKREAQGSTRGLKAGIASTQKLAIRSARSVRQVARRLGST